LFNPYDVAKQQNDIDIFFKPLPVHVHGLYVKKDKPYFIINKLASQVKRRCALAEELGHYFLGHNGNYLVAGSYRERLNLDKQEYDAKLWATDRLIDTRSLLSTIRADHQLTLDDICDTFWVTQEFMIFKMQRLVNLGHVNSFFVPDIT